MPPPYLTHKKVCIRPNQLDVENNTHRCVYVLFSAYGPDGWLYLKQWRRSDLVLPRLGGPHDNRGWEGAHNNEKDLEMRVKQQWSALQQWGQNVSLIWLASFLVEFWNQFLSTFSLGVSFKLREHWALCWDLQGHWNWSKCLERVLSIYFPGFSSYLYHSGWAPIECGGEISHGFSFGGVPLFTSFH